MLTTTNSSRDASSVVVSRVLTSDREVSEIEPAWEKLRSALALPTLENRRGWLEVEANTSDGMMVVTLGRGNETDAIAPFVLKRRTFHCRLGYKSIVQFPMRMARLCGDALLASPDDDVQEAVLEAVSKASVSYDTLLIEGLRVDSPLRRLIDHSPAVQRQFWTYFPEPPAKHWLVRLPKTFAEYETVIGRKQRAQLKARERKLNVACGSAVQLERITSREDIPAFAQAVGEVSKLSWQGRKLGQIIQVGDEQCQRMAHFAAKGWFRGYLLRCESGPIAFVIGLQSDGSFHHMQTGYDPKWSAFAPGNVTLFRLIEDLYTHDMPEVVDFGYGDNEYKRAFGTESFDEQNVFLMRRTLYNNLARLTHRALFKLTDLARSGLRKTGLLERVRRALRSA